MAENEAAVLAVDVGTSSLKAVIYRGDGTVSASAVHRYEYRTQQPGWAEADPADWWNALVAGVMELRVTVPDFSAVRVVALTGQMHTAVLLDEHRQVIPPTLLWLDRRATAETAELQAAFSRPPYQLNSTYTLPKLVWLARHRPEVMSRVRHILWPKDYLRYRLTGRLLTDRTEAGGAALLDWERFEWATERLEWAGISTEILPPLARATDDAGPLLPEVAQSFGLSADVKVIVGSGDVLALVTGAPPAAQQVCCSLGSSSMVYGPLPAGKEIHDPHQRIYVYPLLPYPLLGGVSSTSGAALQWAYRALYASDRSFSEAMAEAQQVSAGAGGLLFLPFLSGERSPYWNDALRGGFYGLTLAHSRADMLRAVMEGVAYSLRYLLDVFEELDFPVTQIALAGGGVTTAGWPALMANVCQRPVVIYAGQETVTHGLYAYACQALDPAVSFEQALARTFQPPQVVLPDAQVAHVYAAGYACYAHFADFAAQDLSWRHAAIPVGK